MNCFNKYVHAILLNTRDYMNKHRHEQNKSRTHTLHLDGYYSVNYTSVFFCYNWRRILPFSTCTAHPLLKLKRFVLLVMKGR